ncbi:ComEC/Rec2-related protein [Rhizobium subbaraonis]|uniref:ComEC/Rec2-related protein n=1 Tax=Rhizobium subbaraonis TaxID=908946 RepID=A0A285U9Y9_9HYPH|nr:ComEC/Rec2 family competence protein [Rhizobium subbaraonis]SOC38725.1 ComEC/Rec2-related protein [Rhizobium subbaraonis]
MALGTATKAAHPVRIPVETPPAALPAIRQEDEPRVALAKRPGQAVRATKAALAVAFNAGSLGAAWRREREYGTGFLFVPLFVGAGAWIWYLYAPVPYLLVICFVTVGLASCLTWHRPGLLPMAIRLCFFLLFGLVLAAIESWRLSTVLLDQPVTTFVTGQVLSREADDRGRMRYRVALERTDDPVLRRPPNVVNLLARSPHEAIAIGARIAGRARLSPPSGPALPGLNDFAFDAYFAGTGAVGFFYGRPAALPPASAAGGGSLTTDASKMIAGWRNAITERIRGQIGGDAGAIAAALVTAEQRGISPDTVEALRQAGLAHVLAISGLNMVLAAGTFLVGARLLLALLPGVAERYPVKKIAAVGGLVMVTLYILISGGAISAIRSWLMIVVMLTAVLFDRVAISMRNIALSALIILAVTPSAVTGPGFQMSYAATVGLVAGYAAWRERSVHRERPSNPYLRLAEAGSTFFAGLLLSSLIGGAATFIYSVGHFHRIPAYGLVGNLVAMPIISIVVMPMAVIAMMLMPFGLDWLPLKIMGWGIDWMIAMAAWVSDWDGDIVTGRLPALAFILIALGGGLVCLFRTRLALLGLLPIAAGAGLAMADGPTPRPQLLVSEDAKLLALVSGDGAATNRPRPPGFVYDQWRRALRLSTHQPPRMMAEGTGDGQGESAPPPATAPGTRRNRLTDAELGLARKQIPAALAEAADERRFICRRAAWCAGVAQAGWRVVWIENPGFLGVACDSADIVVSPHYRGLEACRSGGRLITAGTLRRTGALEFSPVNETNPAVEGTAYAATQAVTALDRPWNRHRLYDWRTDQYADARDDATPIDSGE